jgi:hypothetical protein
LTDCGHDYITRMYREGDETELVGLFNRVYAGFGGFTPRTSAYWRWCCLNRPDVEPEGIVTVNDGKKVIGYGVVGKSGAIWELCYDPAYDGKEIVSKILEWSLNYVESVGGDSITLNAPRNDSLLRDVCLRFEFAETNPPCMFVSLLDFPNFFRELLNWKKNDLIDFDDELLIKLKDSASWYGGNITVKIRNGDVFVEEGINAESGIVLEADVPTILSCILGTKGLLRAFIGLKLRVKPFWKSLKILKLFSLLRIRDPWFSPGADFG